MASSSSIRPLPAEAVAQIKSSIAITSLNLVIIELLKNSLDARSQKIEAVVEYGRGNCTVEDDGLGILPAEFKDGGGLGKLHHTSKHDSTDVAHGWQGSFLASLSALSLVSITSHHHLYRSHNSMSISRSQVIARQIPTVPQQRIAGSNHGTRVVVRDLFGNMPVRVKQRAIASIKQSGGGREWEELRKWATALVLAWPSNLFLSIRDSGSNEKFHLRGPKQIQSSQDLQNEERLLAKVCSALFQAAFISSPDPSKWVYLAASTSNIMIKGALSTEPVPNKAAQFLLFGIHPLGLPHGRNFLLEEVNRIFEQSSFGYDDDLPQFDDEEKQRRLRDRRYKGDGYTSKELRGSRKGLAKWPMFVIKIEISDFGRQHLDSDADNFIDDKRGMLSSVMELLRATILEFLNKHHFRFKSNRMNDLSSKQNLAVERSSSSCQPRLHSDESINDLFHSRTLDNTSPDKLSVSSSIDKGIKDPWGKRSKLHFASKSKKERTGSPFNGWSRVKIGGPRLLIENSFNFKDENKQRQIEQLPTIFNGGHHSNQDGSRVEMPHTLFPGTKAGLVAKSGMITRPPFSDMLEKTPSTAERDLSITKSELQIEDDFVEWTNPLTKARSLVNGRTGAVSKLSRVDRLTIPISSWSKPGSTNQNMVQEKESTVEDMSQTQQPRSWIDCIFRNWNNPVFCPTEPTIAKVLGSGFGSGTQHMFHGHGYRRSQADVNRAFQESSTCFIGKISKHALRQAEIISQVDKKFILIKIPNASSESEVCGHELLGDTLVLVDQHAADERCRVEEFLADLCSIPAVEPPFTVTKSPQLGVATTRLENPITFVMSFQEIQLLRTHSQHFADWGITYDFPSLTTVVTDGSQEHKVEIKSLPPVIVERCRAVPKLLADLIRSEAWKCSEKGAKINPKQPPNDLAEFSGKHDWLRKIHSCPQAILSMLNSKSCRSAIMFNDELSNDQCKALVLRLAECAFPFQCAHGRPSMVPLFDLQTLPSSHVYEIPQNKDRFSVAFEGWKRGMEGRTTT